MQPPETSFELVNLVQRIPITKKSETWGWNKAAKAILLALCAYTTPGEEAWPSIKTIHEDTGFSERHISRVLARLQERRILNRLMRPNQSTQYIVQVDMLMAMSAKADKRKGIQEEPAKYLDPPPCHHPQPDAAMQNISPGDIRAPGDTVADDQTTCAASQQGSRAGIYTVESREPVQADILCSAEQPVQPYSAEQPAQADKAEQPIPAEQPGMSPQRDQPVHAEQTGRPYTAPSSLAALPLTPERAAPIFAGRPAPAHLRRPEHDPNDRYRTLLDRNRYAGMLPQHEETAYDPLE